MALPFDFYEFSVFETCRPLAAVQLIFGISNLPRLRARQKGQLAWQRQTFNLLKSVSRMRNQPPGSPAARWLISFASSLACFKASSGLALRSSGG